VPVCYQAAFKADWDLVQYAEDKAGAQAARSVKHASKSSLKGY